MTIAIPATTEHIADAIDDLFDDVYAVVILDAATTTFDEVEQACIQLFGYTGSQARALSHRVHTTGEAVATVLPKEAAQEARRKLGARNVRSRLEPV
jgi:ATP-dependent Clp protease adapter protein ClpS